METAVAMEEDAEVATATQTEAPPSTDGDPPKIAISQPRRWPIGRRGSIGKRRGSVEKRRGQKQKRRGQEKEGVTVKRTWGGGKRRWDKKHYCVFCRRPQVKIARHLLRKHCDQQEVSAASASPTGSKQRHSSSEHSRCRGNYLHNIEVIRQGSGEIVPWRQPSEEVDARNYSPCPLCSGFFLRADLWKHQVTCRKKSAVEGPAPSGGSTPSETNPMSESTGDCSADPAERTPADPPLEAPHQTSISDPSMDQNSDQNQNQKPPKKRSRVQAAASRSSPISSGASESCSEISHRMNQDNVSYEVKSDWSICKYGNKSMGTQDGSQRSYEYVSQKLRESGRLSSAVKSSDPKVQNSQDSSVPGRLSSASSAARKASGYRWSRPPSASKTTSKTVCEIAIGESSQDGDWEAAARTTDFYHLSGRDWDQSGLQNQDQDPERETKGRKRTGRTRTDKNSVPDDPTRFGSIPGVPLVPPESRLQNSVPGPVGPRKVRRRPWSSAEKEAIWRQSGVHVSSQTVPGKEVCQRCLDSEPVSKGRHWKDVKNQVHNQIQSQKKQQFHAQMGQDQNQNQQNQQSYQPNQQDKQPEQNQQKQPAQSEQNQQNSQYQNQPAQSEQNQQNSQYQNQPAQSEQNQQNSQFQNQPAQKKQPDHQNQVYPPKKQLFQNRPDHQNPCELHKKQVYQSDHQNQQVQTRDSSVVPVPSFSPDGPLRAHGTSSLDREAPYPVSLRNPAAHIEPSQTRTDWAEEASVQNYQMNRSTGQNLLQDAPAPDPSSMDRSCLDRGVRF